MLGAVLSPPAVPYDGRHNHRDHHRHQTGHLALSSPRGQTNHTTRADGVDEPDRELGLHETR